MAKKKDSPALLEVVRWARKNRWGGTREYRFHPVRRWRFDLAFPNILVAFECEGGVWLPRGRHTSGKGFSGDCEKYSTAESMGWAVIRATVPQINKGLGIRWLSQALRLRAECWNRPMASVLGGTAVLEGNAG